MTAACLLSAVMAFGVEWQARLEGPADGFGVSCSRVAGNVLFLIGWLAVAGSRGAGRALSPRQGILLAIWGGLGAVTIATMFASAERIGIGNASFLVSTGGAFTALLAPLALGQRHTVIGWIAIALSLAGVLAMRAGLDGGAADAAGWAFGVASGMAAGGAYLAVARLGDGASPRLVMTAWTLACAATHAVFAAFEAPRFPATSTGWLALGVAGVAAAASQFLTTRAYASGRVATLACLSCLTPVLSLGVEMAILGRRPTLAEAGGCGLITAAALLLGAGKRP